jgi:hypothetical protein
MAQAQMQVLEGADEMAERVTIAGVAVDTHRLGIEHAPRLSQLRVEIAVRRVDGGDRLARDPAGDEISVEPRHCCPGILWILCKRQRRMQAAQTGGKQLDRVMQ